MARTRSSRPEIRRDQARALENELPISLDARWPFFGERCGSISRSRRFDRSGSSNRLGQLSSDGFVNYLVVLAKQTKQFFENEVTRGFGLAKSLRFNADFAA